MFDPLLLVLGPVVSSVSLADDSVALLVGRPCALGSLVRLVAGWPHGNIHGCVKVDSLAPVSEASTVVQQS